MPRPAGSSNKPKGGFPLSKRLEALKKLQEQMQQHLNASIDDVTSTLERAYDDIKLLSTNFPEGQTREVLNASAKMIRGAMAHLENLEVRDESRKEDRPQTDRPRGRLRSDDGSPQQGVQGATAQGNGRLPATGVTAEGLMKGLGG